MKTRICDYADSQAALYRQIALEIHARPEVSNYEFFACQRLSDQMKAEGFDVKVDVAGHRTGFTACYQAKKPGPVPTSRTRSSSERHAGKCRAISSRRQLLQRSRWIVASSSLLTSE